MQVLSLRLHAIDGAIILGHSYRHPGQACPAFVVQPICYLRCKLNSRSSHNGPSVVSPSSGQVCHSGSTSIFANGWRSQSRKPGKPCRLSLWYNTDVACDASRTHDHCTTASPAAPSSIFAQEHVRKLQNYELACGAPIVCLCKSLVVAPIPKTIRTEASSCTVEQRLAPAPW